MALASCQLLGGQLRTGDLPARMREFDLEASSEPASIAGGARISAAPDRRGTILKYKADRAPIARLCKDLDVLHDLTDGLKQEKEKRHQDDGPGGIARQPTGVG